MFCATSLSLTPSHPMPMMVLSVYIPTENLWKDYTCRMAKEGEIQPVNLLTGQSKGQYLGLYKSEAVVQSLHRKHTPTPPHTRPVTTKVCIPDKYNFRMPHIQMERTRLCQRTSSTYHPRD